jgi:hypothetical protein
MEFKSLIKPIFYILLILIVIFFIQSLILISNHPIDRSTVSMPKDPILGYWNQTGNKTYYGFADDGVDKIYGNPENSSYEKGYWRKINNNTYFIRWLNSNNETIFYDSLSDSFISTNGFYMRLK